MQSVENKNNVRIMNPLFLATVILAGCALLMTQGCRTKSPETTKVEPPPQVIMPPAPQPAVAPVLTPPPVTPDFTKLPPPPSTPEVTGGLTYTVKKGDSISKIAAHHGVSAREIAQLNNITDPNKIKVGQTLTLPAYAKEGAASVPSHKKATGKNATTKSVAAKGGKATVKKSVAATAPAGEGEYIVKSGDSLSKIASHLHTSVKALKEANELKSDNLKIGQKLKVPGKSGEAAKPAATPDAAPASAPATENPMAAPAPATPAAAPAAAAPAVPAAAPQTFEITVDAGETLETIATKYGVLPADIKKLNNITEVAPGQKIKLPLPTP